MSVLGGRAGFGGGFRGLSRKMWGFFLTVLRRGLGFGYSG